MMHGQQNVKINKLCLTGVILLSYTVYTILTSSTSSGVCTQWWIYGI